jgi:hypothetical protein
MSRKGTIKYMKSKADGNPKPKHATYPVSPLETALGIHRHRQYLRKRDNPSGSQYVPILSDEEIKRRGRAKQKKRKKKNK